MIRFKFVGSSFIALVAVFSNLANFVNTKYLLVEIEDSKVHSKVSTSRSFGRARAIDQAVEDSKDVAVKSALIEIGDALIHGNNGTVRKLPMSKVFKPPFKAPKMSKENTIRDADGIEEEKIENELENEMKSNKEKHSEKWASGEDDKLNDEKIPLVNATMRIKKLSKGRSFSQRSSRDIMAGDKAFCREKSSFGENSIWPECRVKCYRSYGGRPKRCFEYPAVRYCGCSPEASRAKSYFRLGRMDYVDGRLQNRQIDNAMCADLNRRGFGCRSCTDDSSWANTYVMGKMFPTSSKDTNEKCLEHPEERCDGFDPGKYWFDSISGEGVGFMLDEGTCHHQRHHGETESYCKVDCDVDGFCTETVKQRKCECPSSLNDESKLEERCVTAVFKNGRKLMIHGDDWGKGTFDACDSAEFRCRDCKRKTYYDDASYSYDVTRRQWEEPEYCEDGSGNGSYENYDAFQRISNIERNEPEANVSKTKQTKNL